MDSDYTGFTFNGIHSYNDKKLYYTDEGHVITPAIQRNAYSIAGTSGTILFTGETRSTMTFSGKLTPMDEPESQEAAHRQLREISKWLLGSGRARLIFDRDPDVYYLAEVSQETNWSDKDWFGGQLDVSFEAQPYAYANTDTQMTQMQKVTSTGLSYQTAFEMETGADTPLTVSMYHTGAGNITSVTLQVLTPNLDTVYGAVSLADIALAKSKTLIVSCEAPLSATLDGGNILSKATLLRPLYYPAYTEQVIIAGTLAYTGTDTAKVYITVSGTPRW